MRGPEHVPAPGVAKVYRREAGIAMTQSASIRPARARAAFPTAAGRRLAGALLIGWGGFNLYDGVINHLVLGIHHVNDRVDRAQWPIYDAGFIIWGAAMLLIGFLLLRGSRRERAPQEV